MRKYLELFINGFDETITDKVKVENKPYIGYSLTDGKLAYTVVPTPEQPSLYEAVDLGLPSGLKWANMNVGATSPEDAGMYFQWGDTVGYTKEQVEAGEKVFNWDTYFDTTDGGKTFNKYTQNKLTLLSEDDAATVNMGSEWRMPTADEVYDLWYWTTPTFIDIQGNEFTQEQAQNGAIADGNLKCIRFTGSNGNSIFIPAAGVCYEAMLSAIDYCGYFWSSSLVEDFTMAGRGLTFNYEGGLNGSSWDRYYGLSVRGVKA